MPTEPYALSRILPHTRVQKGYTSSLCIDSVTCAMPVFSPKVPGSREAEPPDLHYQALPGNEQKY